MSPWHLSSAQPCRSTSAGRSWPRSMALLGTIVVQSVINAAALIMLGVVVALTSGLVSSHPYVLPALLALPALAIGVLELLPRLARKGAQRTTSVTAGIVRVLVRVHKGLAALRQPRLIAAAAGRRGPIRRECRRGGPPHAFERGRVPTRGSHRAEHRVRGAGG
jgi:hypothetical protein